ncbi:hypothetical protein GCM10028781_06420 [Nostocoides australiense]
MLRAHVDDDALLGAGADLADDVVPVAADGVEDATLGRFAGGGIQVGLLVEVVDMADLVGIGGGVDGAAARAVWGRHYE